MTMVLGKNKQIFDPSLGLSAVKENRYRVAGKSKLA